MRVEWRPRTPRSTRRLATRPSSPQALVTVDRCGQQARRAAGCASECRDSRVYMSWCLRPIMTWHIPAIGSKISGSRFPLCRRGVNFPRSPKQAWHMRVFRQSERYGHDSLPARTDQRDQGSLRLHPPSSLGAATNEASTASLRERRVRALSFPSGPCAMTCLLRRVPPTSYKPQGAETKQACRAKAKQRTGSYSRTTPCTRRVERTRHFAVCGRPTGLLFHFAEAQEAFGLCRRLAAVRAPTSLRHAPYHRR
jgi:hypothetical protein